MYAIAVKTQDVTHISKRLGTTRAINGHFKRLRRKYPGATLTSVYITEDNRYYDFYDHELKINGDKDV